MVQDIHSFFYIIGERNLFAQRRMFCETTMETHFPPSNSCQGNARNTSAIYLKFFLCVL